MDASIKPNDIIRMIRRRAGMIVTLVVVISGLAFLIAYFIPPTYVASAKILIERQQIPSQLATSTVTASAGERLQLIEQRLMTRSNLLNLIDRLDIYDDRPDLSKSAKVNLMRESTSLQRITVGDRRRGVVAAFTISYSDSNPRRAAKITNEYVTIILEQNLRARSERASETHDFFKEEVAQVEQELVTVQAEIAEFLLANQLSLPDTLEYRRRELATIRDERIEQTRRLTALEEQRETLAIALRSGRYVEAIGEAMTQEERDLEQLRQELSRALSIYAPSHPRVRMITSRIDTMETNLRSNAPDAVLETTDQRIERAKLQLERQLAKLDSEIDLIKSTADRADAREAELSQALQRAPEVALELSALNRRENDLKIRFEEAIRKQAFAATGEKLEVNRQAERFEVIEQAQVPDEPTSPNRPAIAIGGFAGSIGLSLALAILLGLMNSSIRTVGDMERKLEMRPMMTVPFIKTEAERRRARRELYLLATLVLVIVPVSLYAIDQYYLPLELVLEDVIERTKLREIVARATDLFSR